MLLGQLPQLRNFIRKFVKKFRVHDAHNFWVQALQFKQVVTDPLQKGA